MSRLALVERLIGITGGMSASSVAELRLVCQELRDKDALGHGSYKKGASPGEREKEILGRTFYHGSNPGSSEKIDTGNKWFDSKFFVADRFEHAENYGKQVDSYKFKEGSRILVEGTKDFNRLGGRARKDESMLDHAVRLAKAAELAGYDAVYFNLQGTIGTVVLNKSSIEKL